MVVEHIVMPEARQKAPPDDKVSFEAFLEWADEDTCAEWVGGEVIPMVPASNRHQDLCDWLISILRLFIEAHGLGWIRSAPFLMRLSSTVAREPDLLFVTNEHQDRVKEAYLDGPADLVVEIVSLDSIARDRGDKFVEYEAAGVLQRVLFTHDDDLLSEAAKRQREGIPFNGVIYAHQLRVSIGTCIEDLELIAKAGEPEDLIGRVEFLPLRTQ